VFHFLAESEEKAQRFYTLMASAVPPNS